MKTCEIKGLEKSFGQNRVLRGIDLDLQAGKVVVLMGANGAGKSTLVKILCGFHACDAGTMTLSGAKYLPSDSASAISSGVVTVHQSIDDGVIPDLDVATNLMLNRLTEPGARLMVRDRALRAAAQTVADNMGLEMDVRARVADLSVADRQMIAIARAMAYEPKILILDEPTSSLSTSEAERLFHLVDRLRDQGVAILYISHRMSDIRRIADRIVCMRDGEISGVFDSYPLDLDGAVTAMLGHKITEVDIAVQTGGMPVLEIDGISLQAGSVPVSLTATDGEVVAITGLLGSGKSRLAEIIFGLSSPRSGQMRIDGQPYVPASSTQAVAAGVFMSSKDRSTNAVIPDFNIANNMTLPFLKKFSTISLLKPRVQRDVAKRMIDQIGVICQSEMDSIMTLSGGNQQKVMIGRWLLEDCRVLLLDEPFQGVDIGARRDIGRHIRATAKGRATLVFVSELDEALEIADRIIVLNEGAIAGLHENAGVDLSALIAQVTGTSPNSVQVS
jgi:simple sugar transport system ATP-binding protein